MVLLEYAAKQLFGANCQVDSEYLRESEDHVPETHVGSNHPEIVVASIVPASQRQEKYVRLSLRVFWLVVPAEVYRVFPAEIGDWWRIRRFFSYRILVLSRKRVFSRHGGVVLQVSQIYRCLLAVRV